MATKNNFVLEELDASKLLATGKTWKSVSIKAGAEGKWMNTYEPRLRLAAEQVDYSNGESMTYGVFENGKKSAAALIEVCYTRAAKKWIKMLNLHLAPEFDLSIDQNKLDFRELADIFSAAIVGTLMLTKKHASTTMKLYARSTMLLSFFEYIAEGLPPRMKNIPSFKVSIEGRWLVMKI